ncbi:ABC transporter permease [Streptococcus sp. DD11]|uniref:ABC transporter permease n=1 Tax=Streptococcus sp. DD11 TaxID=1777879 RepID=UPI00079C9730|nr:ABC transporter permease [Streptococcus sp. DD11]KXT83582.1 ABC transporter permease [Streptococcus sp. DD11]
MFLAFKEIVYSRGRYRLVVAVVFLITYMVFFLSSLSAGLVRLNRLALDQWQAESVILSEYANHNLAASTIKEEEYSRLAQGDAVAALGQMPAVANYEDGTEKINVQVFGLDWDSFLAPNLVEGRTVQTAHEAVADKRLQQKGVKLGDYLQLNGSEQLYQIVGFTEDNSYFTQPVLFMTLEDFRELKYGSSLVKSISALVVKDHQKIEEAGLSQISMSDLVNNIPGYQAQVLTFNFMIGAMILITFLVLGIFTYIITIQKTHLYGIMRAQGIASGKIIASIFWQIFILSALGISLAVLALLGTQLILPASMPFYSDWSSYAGLTVLIILMSLAGGLLSIHRVLKIDPITAIGGE